MGGDNPGRGQALRYNDTTSAVLSTISTKTKNFQKVFMECNQRQQLINLVQVVIFDNNDEKMSDSKIVKNTILNKFFIEVQEMWLLLVT